MRLDSLLRFWRYINHLLTYLLIKLFGAKYDVNLRLDYRLNCFKGMTDFLPKISLPVCRRIRSGRRQRR